MSATASSIILHQYDVSPFSEKVRVVFGIKGLEWHACEQPAIMPKPELLELTGGYRRIPVLQIGADLYFDSLLIIDELERRFPSPSIYGGCGRGMGHAINVWADQGMFRPVVMALFGGDWDYDDAFISDRSALIGQPFDRAAMKAAAPAAESQLRSHLDLIDRQLIDGRAARDGLSPGDKVRIVYDDANSAPLEATILAAADWSISVRPLHSKLGEIHIHLPRSAGAIVRS